MMKKQARAVTSDFSWFDLQNYEFINDLSVYELVKEIEWRSVLFFTYKEIYLDLESDEPESESIEYEDFPYIEIDGYGELLNRYPELERLAFEDSIKFIRIFEGDPNINKYSDMEIDFNTKMDEITPKLEYLIPLPCNDNIVRPLFFFDLYNLNSQAKDLGVYDLDEFGRVIIGDRRYVTSTVSDNIKANFGFIAVNLNLEGATDKEILASISNLLPLWRKRLNTPEPEIKTDRMGLGALKKLVLNRVLPMLDILLWGKVNNKEIPNTVLDRLIFLDDPKDTQAIKETIKPFALNAISDNFMRSVSLYLKENSELGSAKVSDLMSR